MRIAVFVFEGAEELDFAGPWEVLAAWADQWPEDGVQVFSIGSATAPVRCAKGLRVVPEHAREDAPDFDLLVYPGGRGTRAHLADDGILEWVRGLHARGVTIASVCTGSLVLARAGLLDGLRATTHHGSLDRLAELGHVEVDRDARFVDAGSILTAAGVSAGIDLALHLVRRLHSAARAREVRRYIQYDPEPPV